MVSIAKHWIFVGAVLGLELGCGKHASAPAAVLTVWSSQSALAHLKESIGAMKAQNNLFKQMSMERFIAAVLPQEAPQLVIDGIDVGHIYHTASERKQIADMLRTYASPAQLIKDLGENEHALLEMTPEAYTKFLRSLTGATSSAQGFALEMSKDGQVDCDALRKTMNAYWNSTMATFGIPGLQTSSPYTYFLWGSTRQKMVEHHCEVPPPPNAHDINVHFSVPLFPDEPSIYDVNGDYGTPPTGKPIRNVIKGEGRANVQTY